MNKKRLTSIDYYLVAREKGKSVVLGIPYRLKLTIFKIQKQSSMKQNELVLLALLDFGNLS